MYSARFIYAEIVADRQPQDNARARRLETAKYLGDFLSRVRDLTRTRRDPFFFCRPLSRLLELGNILL